MSNTNYEHKMIITVCNHGFAEDIMDKAREVGARGGTIMKGRGTSHEDETKFFGITIHPEKDILLIVTTSDTCSEIMSTITNNFGHGREAHALCFAVPVDNTLGFSF